MGKGQKYLLQSLWVALYSSLQFLSSCTSPAVSEVEELPDTVNFVNHIAPIIKENCTPCHKFGGGAPFFMQTYKDVAKRSKMVAHVTKIKYMPPWPADKSYSHFIGERGLSQYEIELIQKWHKQGAIRGKGELAKIVPVEKKTPDLVLPIKPMRIEGNNTDQFYIVKVPFEIPKDTFVNVVEFVSGVNQVVHHANGHLLNYEFEKKENALDGKRFILTNLQENYFLEQFDSLKLKHDDETLPERVHSAINYLPGMKYDPFPDGIGGFRINRKGAFVLNDIHYGPYPETIFDSSFIHVYYSPKPPKRPLEEVMLGTNGVSKIIPPLVVPPNEVRTFTTRWQVPFDVSLVSLNPHMHLLGKSIKAFGVKPNGDTIRLISIPQWEFRWQYIYTFEHLLKLPRGTEVVVEATFDNTSDNVNNPNNPPQVVGERLDRNGASMRTTDEMLQFIMMLVPYKEGDEKISLKSSNFER